MKWAQHIFNKLRSYSVLIVVAWTLMMVGLIALNLKWTQDHIFETARTEARAGIEKDLLYRSWNSWHGGVYVPVTDDTLPNPYLQVPERDLTSTSGIVLTLINPAYMNRQVFEQLDGSGVRAHLTSLNPINPNNQPDDWERQALRTFETGMTEVSSVEMMENEENLRLMVAFITKESCLKCHASQGYEVGDVRGGLSVSIPLSRYTMLERSATRSIIWGYGSIWLVGTVGILLALKRLNHQQQEKEKILRSLEQSLEKLGASENKFSKIFRYSPVPTLLGTVPDGMILDVNDKFLDSFGFTREEVIGKTTVDLGIIDLQDRARLLKELSSAGYIRDIELILHKKNGNSILCQYNGEMIEVEGQRCVLSLMQDITAQKQAAEQLRESEASLKASQQVAHVGHWTWDTRTNKVTWSDEMKRVFGLDPESFDGDLNRVIANAIHPEDREKVEASNQAVLTEQKPAPLEYRVVWPDRSVHTIWAVPGSKEADEGGNILRLTGIVQDVTERKQNEELLRLSEERFRTLVTSSEDIIFTLDTSERHTAVFGRWLEKANLQSEDFMGRTAMELMGEEQGRVHHEANRRALDGQNVVYEWQRIGEENHTVHYRTSLSPMYDSEGQVMGIVGIGHDITQLKRTENDLRKREAHFKQAQNLAKLGIWEWDPVTDKTEWSDEMLDLYGITREEFTGNGQDYINFTYPDDKPIQLANIRRDFEKAGQYAIETGQTVDENPDPKEFRIIRPNGSICWVQGDAIEYVDAQGHPLRMLGILRDVTKQKMDEQAIRESEARYRTLFHEMMDGFALHEIVCDDTGKPVDYRFLALNPAFEKLTGLLAQDVIGRTVLEVMPDTEAVWIERYGTVALTGEPDHFEEYSVALNRHYEVRVFSPSSHQFAVIFHDVSQRKHSENITMARMKLVQIATSHSLDTLLQAILDEAELLTGSCIGFYHFMEPDQKTLSLQNWSTRTLNEFCHTNGKGIHYPVDQAGVWVDCIYAKKPVIHNNYAALPHHKGLPEGHAEIVREMVVPVMRGDKIVAILGVGNKLSEYTQVDVDTVQQLADLAIEIVERKRAEDAQLRVQQNLESLIQNVDGIVWEADARTFQFIFVSDQAERLLGYPVQDWLENSSFWGDHIHPEDREGAIQFCVTQTKAGQAHTFEYRMIAQDGQIIWLRDMVSVVVEDGQPSKLRGIMIDITEKKLADEKLHQLSLAVEQSPGSVVITDLNGNIEYVNPKFEQVTGYTLEELKGRNPRLLKSGKTTASEYSELWQTIMSGQVWHGEFQNKKRDGEYFWEDAMISPLTDSSGKITHFVGVKEDITERKRSEREILERNADLAALFSISTHLRTAASANEMLPLVLEEMRNVFHADTNAVILLEPRSNTFVLAMVDGTLEENSGVRFGIENSLSGFVMQTRKPYVTSDFANDPNRSPSLRNYEHLGPAVIVPLQSESEFIGDLLCARRKDSPEGEFSISETQLLRSIGEMVGTALRRARLYDDALLRLRQVQGLHAIDTAITTSMDLSITLNILLNQATKLMEVDAADILIFNPITRKLNYAAGQGFHTQSMEHMQLMLGEGMAGQAALERKPISIEDISVETDPRRKEVFRLEGIQSIFIVPMVAKGQMRGVLELYRRTHSTPNSEWMDFLEALASQAAIAIDNSQLYNDLQRSNLELFLAYDKTIEGWSHALDLKDKETEGHTLRVTAWTVQLATHAGMSESDIVHMRRGALLHDIGKLGIPDRILNKKGKLTPKEWEMMRQHPIYAYNMIKPIQFLRPAIDIPYCHHEKWDGTGYPHGLKGEQIPYAARLFAIIDVWDAVTSDRPYRKAWTFEEALRYIKSESGRQFDPEIVELFLDIVETLKITQLS